MSQELFSSNWTEMFSRHDSTPIPTTLCLWDDADQFGCENSSDVSRIHHSARGHPDVVCIQCNPEGYIMHCQY